MIRTELLIIIFLWIQVLTSVILNYQFDIFLILGIIGLLFVTVTYKINFKFSFLALIIILALSIFNLVSFSLAFGLQISFINIISLVFLFLLLYKRRNYILQLKLFSKTEGEAQSSKDKKVQFFKRKFNDLSEAELNKILNQENLDNEAKRALIEIINSKNNI